MNDLVLSEEYLLLDGEADGHRVVMIGSECLGGGDDDLGRTLMKKLIGEFATGTLIPAALILYNSGVCLAAADAETSEDLLSLEHHGTDVMVCESSMKRYGLEPPLKTGRPVSMSEIADCLMKATVIVRP